MKKSRGQSLVEVAVIGMLAFTFVALGALFFSDDIANVFAGNNPESRFNSSRTVRYENPEDLIANKKVIFNGYTFKPPIEKILETQGYTQTSGSAGQVKQMTDVVNEYMNQLETIITVDAGNDAARTSLINSMNNYKSFVSNGSTGFLDIYKTGDDLQKKIALIEMSTSSDIKTALASINSYAAAYSASISGNRKVIFDSYINDMTNILQGIQYDIDQTLYIKYLGTEHVPDNTAQDIQLLTKIKDHMNGTGDYTSATKMSADERANAASQLHIYYGGGFSLISPSMYNGRKMCETFKNAPYNSVTSDTATTCTIELYAP